MFPGNSKHRFPNVVTGAPDDVAGEESDNRGHDVHPQADAA